LKAQPGSDGRINQAADTDPEATTSTVTEKQLTASNRAATCSNVNAFCHAFLARRHNQIGAIIPAAANQPTPA